MIGIPLSEFGDTYQFKQITAGSYDTVFEITIPIGYLAFIYEIATTFYKDTYIEFRIDDGIAYTFKRELETVDTNMDFLSEVMNIDEPKRYDPPWVATRKIEFIGYNNDTNDHIFEVFCDGICYNKQIARRQLIGSNNKQRL